MQLVSQLGAVKALGAVRDGLLWHAAHAGLLALTVVAAISCSLHLCQALLMRHHYRPCTVYCIAGYNMPGSSGEIVPDGAAVFLLQTQADQQGPFWLAPELTYPLH